MASLLAIGITEQNAGSCKLCLSHFLGRGTYVRESNYNESAEAVANRSIQLASTAQLRRIPLRSSKSYRTIMQFESLSPFRETNPRVFRKPPKQIKKTPTVFPVNSKPLAHEPLARDDAIGRNVLRYRRIE